MLNDTLGQDRFSSIATCAGTYSSSDSHSELSIALIEYIAWSLKFTERIPMLRNPIWLRQPPFTGLSDRNVCRINPFLR